MELETLYLYITSLLPVKNLAVLDEWRKRAGSFESFYKADRQTLLSFGMPESLLKVWEEIKKQNHVTEIFDSMAKNQIQAIPYYDSHYPKLLKEIFDAPAVLFYRGTLCESSEAGIAIVGSRLMSSYGKIVVKRIAEPLIEAGCTIVSGMAYGIDTAAHSETVNAGRRTIAILGSGIDEPSIYPRTHISLANRIIETGGLLLSEYPPGTPALRHHFVARNRIIAGMSLGTCVAECKIKSGALITADFAMDFNRPVYAVPGPINSILSDGPNSLIKKGAIPVTGGEDILEDLNLTITKPEPAKPNVTGLQKRVLECIQTGPLNIENLCESTGANSQEIIAALSMLELQGLAQNTGPEGYVKT